ncbi:hypothetical protein HQ400_07780 [Aeromonas jandaei]|nr:hypothetical protein HQ400_07780 [Aeromonas jandaei]
MLDQIAELSGVDIEVLENCITTDRNKLVFDGKEYDTTTTEGIIDLVLAIQLHD